MTWLQRAFHIRDNKTQSLLQAVIPYIWLEKCNPSPKSTFTITPALNFLHIIHKQTFAAQEQLKGGRKSCSLSQTQNYTACLWIPLLCMVLALLRGLMLGCRKGKQTLFQHCFLSRHCRFMAEHLTAQLEAQWNSWTDHQSHILSQNKYQLLPSITVKMTSLSSLKKVVWMCMLIS